MNFDDSVAYVLYKFYNQLGIHEAPVFVLNLFVPFLVQNGKFFLVGELWRKLNKETTVILIRTCVDCGKEFEIEVDRKTKKIITKGVFYGGVIRRGVGMWACSKMEGFNPDGTIHWVRVNPRYKELWYRLIDFKRLLLHQYTDCEYWECPKCNNENKNEEC